MLCADQPEHVSRPHVSRRLHQALTIRRRRAIRVDLATVRMAYKMTNSGTILVILEYDRPMIKPAHRVDEVSIDIDIDPQAASNNICERYQV